MKSISKKIKSIYLLAMMAILSVCVAVFPVFKTETVNAEEVSNFYVAGAYLKVDKDLEKADPDKAADNFVLMFQAKITKALYYGSDEAKNGDTNNTVPGLDEQKVKFGMAIGLATALADVTTYQQIVDKGEDVHVFDALVGSETSDIQLVEFKDGETTFTYEAGVYYNKEDLEMYPQGTNWSEAYAKDLIAIPFYSVYNDEGTVAQVVLGDRQSPEAKAANKVVEKSAKSVALDSMYAESAKPIDSEDRAVSDKVFTQITGIQMQNFFTSREKEIHEVYYNQADQKFYGNFEVASQKYNATNNVLRSGSLYIPTATKSVFQFASSGYVAGEKWLKSQASHTRKVSDTYLTNSAVMQTLIPGKTYRFYYMFNNTLIYYDYVVASAVFTALENTSSTNGTQGQNLFTGTKLATDSDTTKSNYFTYRYDTNYKAYYMPYNYSSSATDMFEKENFAGHYVLATDFVVPENIVKTVYQPYMSSKNIYTINTTTPVSAHSIGALKYLNNRNTPAFDKDSAPGFTGTFDGRGMTIQTSFGRGGLFGYIKGGTVKNLNIVADFYNHAEASGAITYTDYSYQQEATTLADSIDNGTIENVSITIKESAPKTFKLHSASDTGNTLTYNKPNYDNVSGVIAANGINNSTLKNVIVKCDTLKDVGTSIQNYRAALNVDKDSDLENVFVIGSSYSNMSISDDYTLTISLPQAPAGFAFDTVYALNDTANAALNDKYGPMIIDMYKWMRNEDVSAKTLKIKFVEEKAMHFADDAAFKAYITNADNEEIKDALINSGMWKADGENGIAWARDLVYASTKYDNKTNPVVTYGDEDFSYVPDENGKVTTDSGVRGDEIADDVDPFVDYFGWNVVFGGTLTKYEVRIVLATGDTLITLPQA